MPIESSMSVVTGTRRSDRQLFEDLVVSPRDLVNPPVLLIAAGKAITYQLYQNVRILENCGTVAVYWMIGGAPSAGAFNGVLKACAGADDGSGGRVDLSRLPGDVYIAPVTGGTCRVVATTSIGIEGL